MFRGRKNKGSKTPLHRLPDYLCDCKDYHDNLVVTRNHTIVSGSRIPVSASKVLSLYTICGCNKGQPIAFYCNEHHDIICCACKTLNHHKCKTSNVQEKCLTYKLSKLNLIMAEIKSLTDKYDHLKQVSNGNKKEIYQLKEACTTEIKLFRNELDRILAGLERNILMELDNLGTK